MKSITDLLQDYDIDIEKRSGDNLICFCPFHDDVKTPNLTIYVSTNSWFCFGCSKGGGIVEFVEEIEGITKKEAKQKLFPKKDDLTHLRLRFDHMKDKRDKMEELTLNDDINFTLSRQCYSHLKDHTEEFDRVFKTLKQLDERLTETVTIKNSRQIIEEFNKSLKE